MFMTSPGYTGSNFDRYVYFKRLVVGMIYLLLCVNDILIAAKNMFDVISLKKLLSNEFEMKDLSPATKILGIEISKDHTTRMLYLS